MEEQMETPAFSRRSRTFTQEMALLLGPLNWMMKRGVLINVDYKNKMKERFTLERDLVSARANALLGREINLASPKQVIELLFDELKLKGVQKRTSDEDAIRIFQAKYPEVKILNHVLQHRTRTKTIGNYWGMPIEGDNRARCSYLPTTEFGRLRSRANSFGYGTNLQNIDRRSLIRKMFIADLAMIMLAADLEQAELRIVAHLCNCWKMIELLENGSLDAHSEMARSIIGVDREVTKKERDLGKRVVHASNYGMGARQLVRICRLELGMNLSESEAKRLQIRYFNTYPQIKMWQLATEARLNKSTTIITPMGRERTFFDRPGPERTKKALACVPQGTIGDLLNKIMTNVFNKFNRLGVFELLLQTHDEFICQVPTGTEEEWIERLKPEFRIPVPINGRDVFIPVKFKTGPSWGELK
jgi:DNA polymerase-1